MGAGAATVSGSGISSSPIWQPRTAQITSRSVSLTLIGWPDHRPPVQVVKEITELGHAVIVSLGRADALKGSVEGIPHDVKFGVHFPESALATA